MCLRCAVLTLLSVGLFCIPNAFAQQPTGECNDYDRVLYEAAPMPLRLDATGTEVVVRVLPPDTPQPAAIQNLKKQKSPQGTATLVTEVPDTSKPGPWNTTLHIFGNTARPLAMIVEVRNHNAYDVNAQWINEKLLSLQAWLGRIVSWDLILDVETGKFIYAETADYGRLILPCNEKIQLK